MDVWLWLHVGLSVWKNILPKMSEEAKEKGNSKSAHRKKKGKKVTPPKYSGLFNQKILKILVSMLCFVLFCSMLLPGFVFLKLKAWEVEDASLLFWELSKGCVLRDMVLFWGGCPCSGGTTKVLKRLVEETQNAPRSLFWALSFIGGQLLLPYRIKPAFRDPWVVEFSSSAFLICTCST